MNNLAQKYNRFLIFLFVISPIASFVFFKVVGSEFLFLLQLLSYGGVILLAIHRSHSSPFKFPSYLIYYVFFVLFVFYSTFVMLDREFKLKYMMSNHMVGGINMIIIIANTHITKKLHEDILKVSKAVLIIAVGVILIQELFDSTFFVRSGTDAFERATGLWGKTQNRLMSIYSWEGGFLSVGYGYIPIFLLVVEDLLKQKKKVVFWVISGFVFVLLAKNRWMIVNALLVFLLILVYSENKKRDFFRLIVFVPLIFILSINVLDKVGVNASGIVAERILESDVKDPKKKKASTRLLAFESFNRFFWDQPIFGMGDKKYGMGGTGKHDYKLERFLNGRSAQIHVGYLSLFYKFGIIGGVLFMTFSWFFTLDLYRAAKRTKSWAPLLGFIGFALGNLTQVHFSFFYGGLIIALAVDKYNRQNNILKLG